MKKAPHPSKARDLRVVAVVCSERAFKESIAAFEYADPSHKRYTLFKHVINYEQTRGQRWDGYIELRCSKSSERDAYNTIQELRSRGVKKVTINYTDKGPILVWPTIQVNS